MKVLHIVPRLPPAIDGVGDFAASLGKRLELESGVSNLYLSAENLREQSREELIERIEELTFDRLLLHYSGYGYHKRGAPMWLVDGLETLSKSRSVPIAIFFHELWVSSWPWKTPFYFKFAQKNVVQRLHRLASASFTSTPRMKRLLECFGEEATLTPIPSSIPAIIGDRARSPHRLKAIVFGQEHTRARSVDAHSILLRSLAQSGRLEVLKLVGKDARPGSSDHIAAVSLFGAQYVATAANGSADEIGQEFANSDIFLSFYPLAFLTKSSTVMAAFACGCPVILPLQRASEEFSPPPPVLLCGGSKSEIAQALGPENLENTSREAQRWYERYANWDRLIEKIAPALGLVSRMPATRA